MPSLCNHCEKPGNGVCSICHGTGLVERPAEKANVLKRVVGITTQVSGCTSCNNPSFPGRERGDGKCFFCKGRGYIN